MTPRNAHRVFVVVFDDFQLLDAAGPVQVFASSNDEPGRETRRGYAVHTVSATGGLVRSTSGLCIATEPLPTPARTRGATIIIAGGEGARRTHGLDVVLDWVGKTAPAAARIGSVCTGAFILARSGLLDGGEAVTHWQHVAEFKAAFPSVAVRADALYVRNGNIYSSAGVTAGIDLCLSLVEQDHGRDHALAIAKRLVVHHKRAGGQLQFSSELLAQAAPSPPFDALVRTMRERPNIDWSIPRMAAAATMSPRSFHRKFGQALGMTPAQFLGNVRLEKACALIEREGASLKTIARKAGFGSEVNMKNSFTKRLGVTPTQYLARFRA